MAGGFGHFLCFPLHENGRNLSQIYIGIGNDKDLGAFYFAGQVPMGTGMNLIDSRRKLDSGEPNDLITQLLRKIVSCRHLWAVTVSLFL